MTNQIVKNDTDSLKLNLFITSSKTETGNAFGKIRPIIELGYFSDLQLFMDVLFPDFRLYDMNTFYFQNTEVNTKILNVTNIYIFRGTILEGLTGEARSNTEKLINDAQLYLQGKGYNVQIQDDTATPSYDNGDFSTRSSANPVAAATAKREQLVKARARESQKYAARQS